MQGTRRWISGCKIQYATRAGETGTDWEASGKREREGLVWIKEQAREDRGQGEGRAAGCEQAAARHISVPDRCGLTCLLIKLF